MVLGGYVGGGEKGRHLCGIWRSGVTVPLFAFLLEGGARA